MKRSIILVIGFGAVECLQPLHPGDDRARERMRLVELRDIGLGEALLAIAGGENLGSILCPLVRPLPVQLGRIMRHRKIDLQQAAEGDLLRIECNLHRIQRGPCRRS